MIWEDHERDQKKLSEIIEYLLSIKGNDNLIESEILDAAEAVKELKELKEDAFHKGIENDLSN